MVPRLRRYYRGAPTPRRSSRLASVALAWRYRAASRCSLPRSPDAALAGQGSSWPVPLRLRASLIAESTGPPRFLGKPPCVFALLFDPGRAEAPGHTALRCCRRLCQRRRPPRKAISGLNHTAPTLAVYASQCGSPRAHARLASGWWPTFAGQDWVPARAHVRRFRCSLCCLLSSLHLPLLQASPGALTRGLPSQATARGVGPGGRRARRRARLHDGRQARPGALGRSAAGTPPPACPRIDQVQASGLD